MASTLNVPSTDIETRLREMEQAVKRLAQSHVSVTPQAPSAENRSWLERWFPGITLLGFAVFAFWLGTLHTTISSTSLKVDKVAEQVAGASRDSLSSRMSVMETKIETIDTKLDQLITTSRNSIAR